MGLWQVKNGFSSFFCQILGKFDYFSKSYCAPLWKIIKYVVQKTKAFFHGSCQIFGIFNDVLFNLTYGALSKPETQVSGTRFVTNLVYLVVLNMIRYLLNILFTLQIWTMKMTIINLMLWAVLNGGIHYQPWLKPRLLCNTCLKKLQKIWQH